MNIPVQIPFKYQASVVRKRHRIPEDLTFRSEVTVEFRSFTSIDAPVACRWNEIDNRDGSVTEIELRFFEDEFWRPVTDYLGNRKVDVSFVDLLDRLDPRSSFRSNLFGDVSEIMKLDVLDPEDYKSVLDTEAPDQIREITERVRGLLIIDGQVWQRVAEPKYVLLPPTINYWEMRYDVSVRDDLVGKDERDLFAVTDFDGMLRYFMQIQGVGEDEVRFSDVKQVEVVTPEAMTFDPEPGAVAAAVHEVLSVGENSIKNWHRTQIIDWVNLREQLAEVVPDQSADDLDETSIVDLCNAARSYCETYLSEKQARRADAVFDRFESSLISLDFAQTVAP